MRLNRGLPECCSTLCKGFGAGGCWILPVKVAYYENGVICCRCFERRSSEQKGGSQLALVVGPVVKVGVQDGECLTGGGCGDGEPCNGADTERTSTREL